MPTREGLYIPPDLTSDRGKRQLVGGSYVPPGVAAATGAGMGVGQRDLYAENQYGSSIYISNSFISKTVALSSAQALIGQYTFSRPILLVNPSAPGYITNTTTLVAAGETSNASANAQAQAINVAPWDNGHIFLNVTANAGTYDFLLQTSNDGVNWYDAQALFVGVNATGQFYANVGSIGMTTYIALRWNQIAVGAITFGAQFFSKSPGAAAANTVYIGTDGVTSTSGYPLLGGDQQEFVLGENVALYGITTGASITLRVFEL